MDSTQETSLPVLFAERLELRAVRLAAVVQAGGEPPPQRVVQVRHDPVPHGREALCMIGDINRRHQHHIRQSSKPRAEGSPGAADGLTVQPFQAIGPRLLQKRLDERAHVSTRGGPAKAGDNATMTARKSAGSVACARQRGQTQKRWQPGLT